MKRILFFAVAVLFSGLLQGGRGQIIIHDAAFLHHEFDQRVEMQKKIMRKATLGKVAEWRFVPSIIWNDGNSSTRLEVKDYFTDEYYYERINAVKVKVTGDFLVNNEMAKGKEYDLFDDGTHGDVVANDKVFTIGKISYAGWPLANDSLYWYGEEIAMVKFGEIFVDFSNTNFFQYGSPKIGLLKEGLTSSIYSITDSIQTASNVVNIIETSNDFYPLAFRWHKEEKEMQKLICQKFYPFFGDEFDFLIFLSNRHLEGTAFPNSIYAFHILQKNPGVKGIGLSSTYDFSQEWEWEGGTPNILGTTYLDPAHLTSQIFTHELTHQWGVWLNTDLRSSGAHWKDNCSVGGILGGSLWQKNGNGSDFLTTGFGTDIGGDYMAVSSLPALELYLWGLADSGEVAPLYVAENEYQSFFAVGNPIIGPFREVSIQEIIRVNGLRVPTPATSQKEFRAAFIVITDQLLSPEEMTFFNLLVEKYGSNDKVLIDSPIKARNLFIPFRQMIDGAILNTKTDNIIAGAPPISPKPNNFLLFRNYPNPFNPETTIEYQLPYAGHVTLKIFDVLGKEIRVLVNENREAGIYQIQWDGQDNQGREVAAGIYLYRIHAGSFVSIKKMTLLK